jgi:hypothetical protein
MGNLTGETHAGISISFSHAAYADAMERYNLKDVEEVARKLEKGIKVDPEVVDFFRDFAIVQEVDHPDFDRGIAIGSLATRIELATGQVTAEELDRRGIDQEAARAEYDLIFG